MERYEAYKDSGIEWIGAIPVDWGLAPVKGVSKIVAGKTPRSDNEKYWGGDIPWITPADMSEKYTSSGARSITEIGLNDAGLDLVPENSIIVSNRAPIGLISIASNPLSTNQGCKALVLEKGVPDYLYYCLACSSQELERLGKGTTFLELSAQDLGSHKIPWPSARIQTAISEYLDQKTAEIDSLIEQTERSIKLLEEYRKSVISEAVTKGLDPDAPTRDSGIEWIGEIPEHWDVDSLSRSMDVITNGYVGPTRNLFHDSGVRYIQSLHVVEGVLDFQKQPYYVSEEWSFRHSRSILQEGDVLVVQTGAIGNVAYVNSEFEGCNCHALIILRSSNGVLGRYLFYCLLSSRGKDAMLMTKTGATHPHLNSTKICRVSIPIPPIEDQKSIVDRLDKMEDHVFPIISDKKRAIAALKEYRKSLISEAVTGKFKVPGVE